MKKYLINVLIILFFVVGIGFIVYPFVGYFVSDYTSTRVVENYENQIKSMNQDKIINQKNKMIEINKKIKQITINPLNKIEKQYTKGHIEDNKENEKEKKKMVFKDGEMIAWLSIPKIDVALPICEGTREETLSHAVGHLIGTSLPYGGKNTHSFLAGHSGLSYATIFSNLNLMTYNDVFYIKVLNETHEYKVDFIKTIKPNEAYKYTKIEKGQDYVTLVTCAPLTINTHRLLVRGHRIAYDGKLPKINQRKAKLTFESVIISSIVIILIIFIIYIMRKMKRRKNEKRVSKTGN